MCIWSLPWWYSAILGWFQVYINLLIYLSRDVVNIKLFIFISCLCAFYLYIFFIFIFRPFLYIYIYIFFNFYIFCQFLLDKKKKIHRLYIIYYIKFIYRLLYYWNWIPLSVWVCNPWHLDVPSLKLRELFWDGQRNYYYLIRLCLVWRQPFVLLT